MFVLRENLIYYFAVLHCSSWGELQLIVFLVFSFQANFRAINLVSLFEYTESLQSKSKPALASGDDYISTGL